MHHRIAIIAIAAAALIAGACADQEGGTRFPTEPRDATPAVRYVTTGSAAVVNPRTGRLEPVKASLAPGGVSASVIGTTVTTSGFQVASYEPGIAPVAGHTSFSFTDSTRHLHKIVLLYRTGGGPPAAMQHYTDGVLVSTTAYSWLKTTTGWLRTRSFMQSVRNGVLVGTYTTLTTLPKTPIGGGAVQPVRLERTPADAVQRTLGTIAYALAFAFAPQDATAQFYFVECRQQWLHYAVAAAVLSGAAAAIASAPELTPVLLTTFIAALGTAAGMEDLLIDCMLANDSLALGGFGTGGYGGGSGTSATGGGDASCLEGSYAPQCSTPFTL